MWVAKASAKDQLYGSSELVLLIQISIFPLLYKCMYIYTDTEKERNIGFKDVTTFNQLKGKENILLY